jgi:hypothetical protein
MLFLLSLAALSGPHAVTDWKTLNLRARELPPDIEAVTKGAKVEQGREEIGGVNTVYQVLYTICIQIKIQI